MSKTIYSIFRSLAILIAVTVFSVATSAKANIIPTLSLSKISNSSAQVTVYGDPNSSVELHYGKGAALVNVIGQTDGNGNLSLPLDTNSYNIACGSTAYVYVDYQQSQTISWTFPGSGSCGGNLPLNPTSLTVSLNQMAYVNATTNTGLTVSANSNPVVASASINGRQITITGLYYGTTNITICANDGSNQCGVINVTVPGTGAITTLSFSQSNVQLTVGQTKYVTISGGAGNYYISSNPAPSSVTASLNGSVLALYGAAFGGSTISVCQTVGSCAMVYVAVVNDSSLPISVTQTSSSVGVPVVSAFSVSSNSSGGQFVSPGSLLQVSFSTNQPVSSPMIAIGSAKLAPSGSGSGPYSATYTANGSEGSLVPLAISFVNASGQTGGLSLMLGTGNQTTNAVSAPVTTVTTSSGAVTPASATAASTVTLHLAVGSSGPEVTKLQQTLKKDGFYSGAITGYFGAQTEAAVKKFQKKHGLAQVGYVGPSTRAILNK